MPAAANIEPIATGPHETLQCAAIARLNVLPLDANGICPANHSMPEGIPSRIVVRIPARLRFRIIW